MGNASDSKSWFIYVSETINRLTTEKLVTLALVVLLLGAGWLVYTVVEWAKEEGTKIRQALEKSVANQEKFITVLEKDIVQEQAVLKLAEADLRQEKLMLQAWEDGFAESKEQRERELRALERLTDAITELKE